MTTRHAQSPAVPADVRAAQGFDPAQSAGLLVGVSRFDDDLFMPVPFAVDRPVEPGDAARLFPALGPVHGTPLYPDGTHPVLDRALGLSAT